jgi:pyruvate,water dikinase
MACPAAVAAALGLALTDEQRASLGRVREQLGGRLFAVRSSSPEEDLVGASFAGGYATRLGVRCDGLEEAVRTCFASSLAARVLHYKDEHGFDPFAPRIAVVIQEQLDAQVAGVAFSLNPLNNDHDEVVVDACWGLGETVVAGLAMPDHFVVNKHDHAIAERRLGAKQRSLWLRPDGGSEQRCDHRVDELCLSDEQLIELAGVTEQIEQRLGRPVDVEWARARDRLFVLQARPVTAYVPLPDALMTQPGERRRLWMDASLSNGLTLNVPVSPLGLDWLHEIFTLLLERFVGPLPRGTPVADALYLQSGGRLYANLSHLLTVQGPEQLRMGQDKVDTLMAATLGSIDAERYRSKQRPQALRTRNMLKLPRVVWGARALLWRVMSTLAMPARGLARHHADVAAVEAGLRDLDTHADFEELMQRGLELLLDGAFASLWAGLAAYGMGLAALDKLAGPVDTELAMRVQQGFEGNVVIAMGTELHALARLAGDALQEPQTLAARITAREMPDRFLAAWDGFLHRHGHRGPAEMDLASARYADDPMLAVSHMAAMAAGPDPGETHPALVTRRQEAFDALMSRSGVLRRSLMRYPNHLLGLFAGTRDTPKHLLTLYNQVLRRAALAHGAKLVAAGRLDAPEHVFDLHRGQLHSEADLRATREQNTVMHRQLRELGVVFPPVIDSRGRIIRPPRLDRPGELRGMGVSPGVARGRVRRLHGPDATLLEPGCVLVAYTTDPGWTPLFVNVAAVVLEIGGTLQHGALVAREYGKPCVVGISQVLERLADGQLVEVDGVAGVVRLLD